MGPFDVDSDTTQYSQKVSDAEIALEIERQSGNVSAVARELKMRRGAVQDRINVSTDLAVILEDNREDVIDEAEKNMFLSVRAGDLKSSKYILSTLGKNRGYGTRSELTGLDGAPIEATVTYHRVTASKLEAA